MDQQFENELTIPEVLPLLPVRDIVVFPYMVVPLFIGRESSIAAVDEALNSKRMIFLSTQKDPMMEDPGEDDIYKIGTVAMILRMLKLPDGRVKILVQGLKRGEIEEFVQKEQFFKTKIKTFDEEESPTSDLKVEALIRYVKEQLAKAVNLGKPMLPDLLAVIDTINIPGKLADIIAANLGLKTNEAQEILEKLDFVERLNRVSQFLTREISILEVQNKILSDAKGEIDKSQREYFLKEQLKAIRKELGDEDDLSKEVEEFEEKLKKLKMPKEVKEEATKQLKRLSRMHSDSAEATVVRTFLEWIVELPWGKYTKDNLDIENAKKVLEEDHYGLEEVKDRILDFLAVRKLNSKMKSPIICFVGPPGVGKTSLGRSIARAMGRKFVRISLGGLRDEAEIRGHRRTYIGALPGKIIQGLRNAGSSNPVFMLDEIDKLGSDFRGDPSSALLEVLDPEQNNAFVDHYLGVPYDLSKVMFITTANYLDPIPPALKDRMEIIHIPGYIEEEKIQIAKKYLVPRQIVENGLKPDQLFITDKILSFIISGYTRESGLRNLERLVGTICRKVARRVATGEDKIFKITKNNVIKYLGPVKYYEEDELKENEVGIVTGLAWTPYGGDVLFIESAKYKGKGNLVLTGQLGDVMKESARAALTFVRSIAEKYNIEPKLFEEHDIHLHVPAGAIPKDGPSAGITMATAIFSLFSGKKVKKDVAMTGEITITGKVLPIGGLKEKLLAAKRLGIKTVVIPKKNENDLIKLSKDLKKGIHVIPVERFEEVLRIAIEDL
ncbi:ATP-dependent proteinase [Calditerrivibrio nitroreducens DSM 19672]|uniref:Lon protease n=1 Tax=Calditerrivibrio nitroreducens (strain DSM 19672 / NBRC 101217 / Yu37-1) TaxID=768670 RepID=E4TFG7_CALNY|nr:endopeptidase La [Calditerrivibrio nitroreducens]ADR19540.1 ATP-dependent proteinase [Calditerrivibrio nitroreducens DSM 19672]